MGPQSIPHFDIAMFGAFALAIVLTGIVVLLSVVVRYHGSDEKELVPSGASSSRKRERFEP